MTRDDEIDPSPALAGVYLNRKASTGSAEETMRSVETYLDRFEIPPPVMARWQAERSRALAGAKTISPAPMAILRREVLPPRPSWWTMLWMWLVPR